MYLFYIDESGTRDPDVGTIADGKYAKDWLHAKAWELLCEPRYAISCWTSSRKKKAGRLYNLTCLY